MNPTTFILAATLLHIAWAYDPAPRWGQAQMLISDSLFLYGGKSDPFNSFSYTGAPSTNDLLYLPLSSPFNASSPPWSLIASSSNESTPQGPKIAWSTLAAVNTSMGILFGGIADPNSDISIQTLSDSTVLVNVFNRIEPSLALRPSANSPSPYANEPARRMQHAACSAPDGRVFIIGGVKPDGSGNAFSQHYIFDIISNPASPRFVALESDTGPPDVYGHTCLMLSNGYLLVFGGLSPSSGGLITFDIIWALDTTQVKDNTKPIWFLLSVDSGNLPPARRNFVAVLLTDGRILIHGGQDAQGQTTLNDGWILNLNGDGGKAVWTVVDVLKELGARKDHFAITSGDEVIFGFGYSSSSPAPAPLQIYNVASNTFVSSYTPPAILPSPTISEVSQTPTSTPTSGSGGLPISGTATGVHPTHTLGSGGDGGGSGGGGGNGNGADGGSNSQKNTTAIAVGSALGAIGFLLIVGGVIWYYRRQSRERWLQGQFAPLDDGDECTGDAFPGAAGERNGNVVGAATVSAAIVGAAAGLVGEKIDGDRMRGGAPSDPQMKLPDVDINELRDLPHLRNTIYNNISTASFATPLPPSPTSSRFASTRPSEGGVVGVVNRGVDAVAGVVTAGVATLAGVFGLSISHQRDGARVNSRPPPRSVHILPERRDMLADEDTRDFAYTGLPGHPRWRSGSSYYGSSERKRAWYEYERRQAEGSAGSSWSLMSIFAAGGGGIRGLWNREPSTSSRMGSRVGTPWHEKGDPFEGDWKSTDEEGYISVVRDDSESRARPLNRREYSNVSTISSLRYVDPFADPIQEVGREGVAAGTLDATNAYTGQYERESESDGQGDKNHLQRPQLRTVLPASQLYPQKLSPLSEQPSQPSLISQSQHQLERTRSQTLSQQSYAQSQQSQDHPGRSRADSSVSSSHDHSQVLSPFETPPRPSSSHTSFGLHQQAHQSYGSPINTPSMPYHPSSTSYFTTRPSSILDPPTSATKGDNSFGNAGATTTLLSTAPTQPMRRSDTWWARFARTRFRDRRGSDASKMGATGGLIDIRDPNPPPRLNTIVESQNSGSASGGASGGSKNEGSNPKSSPGVAGLGAVRSVAHGKSTSSLQTSHTMDSEALERLAGTMDVVQRVRDGSGGSESAEESFRYSRADTLTSEGSEDLHHDADVAALAGMFRTQSPTQMSDDERTPLTSSPDYPAPIPATPTPAKDSSPVTPQSSSSAGRRRLTPRPPSGGNVAAQVAAYERRMSQDMDSPVSANIHKKEEHARRKHIDYGLVPRTSLFVANPDSKRGSSTDS